MVTLHVTTPPLSVAAHVALDQLLLREANTKRLPPLFRLCPLADEAVVVGISQDPDSYVHLDRCREDGVPVLKRFSGGGAVFVGPGCVVFSVTTRFGEELRRYDVPGAYHHVLGPVVDALRARGLDATFEPPCDIAVDGRKIAGNAQAQKRNAVVVHGTFLVEADIARIEHYLKHPDVAPDYRVDRPHSEFVVNLSDYGLNAEDVEGLLKTVWAPQAKVRPVSGALLEEARACADSFLVL